LLTVTVIRHGGTRVDSELSPTFAKIASVLLGVEVTCFYIIEEDVGVCRYAICKSGLCPTGKGNVL
jgi:hypothetical protein